MSSKITHYEVDYIGKGLYRIEYFDARHLPVFDEEIVFDEMSQALYHAIHKMEELNNESKKG